MKDECTFRCSNFIIIGLCNSSANCWLDIILFPIADLSCVSQVAMVFYLARVTAPPEVLAPGDFLSKTFHFDWVVRNIKCFITLYFIRSCSYR